MTFKVLVITNRKHIEKRFCGLLLDMDIEYHVIHAGEKILFQLLRFEPHLTLIDIELQDEPGYETCKRMVTEDSNNKVVLFTNITTNLIREQAIRSGARDLLIAPFSDSEFMFTVKKYLEEFHVEAS